MVQLKILSGSQAGCAHMARQFPLTIGRAADAHLRLADAGVWDRHLELTFTPAGFRLRLCDGALATLNGEPFADAVLRNGDRIVLGSVALQFWLAEVGQRNFVVREQLTWLALALLGAAQMLLIAWLLW